MLYSTQCLRGGSRAHPKFYFVFVAVLAVQAAFHRISGYSGEHSWGEGHPARPVAPQEAFGRIPEPSPCWLLPESLEDPAEGQSGHRERCAR